MVQRPRDDKLRRSLSQSDGDPPVLADGLDANTDLRTRAFQRYHRIVKTDPQLQELAHDDSKVKWLLDNCGSCVEMIAGTCKVYADRPAFGFSEDGSDKWRTMRYRELWENVEALAAGAMAKGLYKRGDFVGICGFSSPHWILADFADFYLGATTVPLPTNIQAEDIQKIINEAELTCLYCSAAEFNALAGVIGGCPTVKAFVAIDLPAAGGPAGQAPLKKLEGALPAGCQLCTMEDLLSEGRGLPKPKLAIPGKDGVPSNPIVTLFYTSGSTGLPKGAMYTESIWLEWWRSMVRQASPIPIISLGFLPLNHLMGRIALLATLINGGTMYFTRNSDMSTLFEDIASVRPTTLVLAPRISNMLYDKFQSDLAKQGGASNDEAKQALISQFRDKELGGRIFGATTGSAPTAPEVVEFLKDALVIPITEGYGSTEAGMMTSDGNVGDNVLDFKLVDVPELGYFTTDKPFPRGELLIKTKTMIAGYYKHQDAWDKDTQDGYMMTGDVVEQRADRVLIWIDRKKNIMKLSQGEFVSVSRLEAIYQGSSALIHQMYIYGSGLRSYLLAVVVPSKEAVAKFGSGPELKKALRRDIDDLARKKALQGYEIPRDFIVELEPFSKENHLLTDSSKPARGKLKSKYGELLEGMYREMEQRQKDKVAAMRQQAAAGSVAEKVKQAVSITLGVDASDLGSGNESFNQLGGDSLASIQFAREVEELCGVNLPVSFVLDNSHSLKAIITKVEEMLKGDAGDAITFKNIHANDTSMIKASDLAIRRFAPRSLPEGRWSPEVEQAAGLDALPSEPTQILLTGANGFLGRFLLLDLLRRVSNKKGGRVVAIVRGNGDEAAWSRLRAGYDSGDPELLSKFDSLASQHLQVYAGDLSKPNLGLKPDDYRELATNLDTIFHNGALVNHAFTYEQLFEPNVLGSLEVMKMAVRFKRKAVTFISSVGVVGGLDHPEPVLESELGTNLATQHPGSNGYAIGYGCSKWATEVQLQQLHEQFGVPVSVFRCGMILAHSKYLGQINPTDMFTRLLASLVYTGIAPRSFYADPNSPDRHYDGMPIDFVAEGIAGVASAQRSGIGCYHVVNPHWDDHISLDSIVDWVISAGYPIRRVADYTAWYTAFQESLKRLDSKLQANSSLPIVYQWENPISGPATKYDAAQMRRGVKETTRWPDVPHLSEEFIHQNLRHMVALNIINPPPSA